MRFSKCGRDDSTARILREGDRFVACPECAEISATEYVESVMREYAAAIHEAQSRLEDKLRSLKPA